MVYIVKWRPATDIPAMARFREKHKAFDQACALLSAREQNVKVYENGKFIPRAEIKAYCDSRPKTASKSK